jgi:hypothetical protein
MHMAKLRHLIPLAALLAAGALHAAPAAASSTQETIMQDDAQVKGNPPAALANFKALGVTRVRVSLLWDDVAPAAGSRTRPRGFNASDPGAYGHGFDVYDEIVRDAKSEGIGIYFVLTGPAPLWATGSGVPRGGAAGPWKPSAREFGAFVHAAGARYSGSYRPRKGAPALPRVTFWSIWNEPNYGYDLAPEASGSLETGAIQYRGLLDAAWGSLRATGHRPGRDTILSGETAPRGVDPPGIYNGVKPLRFLRALYCVDSRYRPLRGSAARARGCPTTAAGTRAFRGAHPGLFQASGFADHPYALQANPGPPNVPTTQTGAPGRDPDFADLPQLGALEGTLDRLNRVYGSRSRFPIWNTEFGYRTHPPDPRVRTSQATAALYMNWAEYLSWRNPRLNSFMQFLYVDPYTGVFASGLYEINGHPKATLTAFRMPLYMPSAATRRGRAIEVWGGARPAAFVRGPQTAVLQFKARRGGWKTIGRVRLNRRGYFDVRTRFSSSGTVRASWRAPGGSPLYSRYVSVTVR